VATHLEYMCNIAVKMVKKDPSTTAQLVNHRLFEYMQNHRIKIVDMGEDELTFKDLESLIMEKEKEHGPETNSGK
jgi:hypothetical protein